MLTRSPLFFNVKYKSGGEAHRAAVVFLFNVWWPLLLWFSNVIMAGGHYGLRSSTPYTFIIIHTHTLLQHSAPERRDRECVCAERARIKSSLDLCSYYTFKKATDWCLAPRIPIACCPRGSISFRTQPCAHLARFNSPRRCLIITIIAAPDQDKTHAAARHRLNMRQALRCSIDVQFGGRQKTHQFAGGLRKDKRKKVCPLSNQ